MLTDLYDIKDDPKLDHIDIKGVICRVDERGYLSMVNLDKRHTFTLVTGYSAKLRDAVISRWQYLENQLEILKAGTDTKKRQLEAMEALSHLLPEDLSVEAVNYIKANTTVNKAVSNLFGFPKMLKKSEMSPDMITVRDRVLDDYIKLYEVLGDNGQVKNALYAKWCPMRLERAA